MVPVFCWTFCFWVGYAWTGPVGFRVTMPQDCSVLARIDPSPPSCAKGHRRNDFLKVKKVVVWVQVVYFASNIEYNETLF